MTNTKFRKRALLSSVAMLLVALVALGSATFAWFTSKPDANASGLSLKATSSTGLLIQSDTEKNIEPTHWTHDAVLRTESITNGVSTAATGAVNVSAASQDASSGNSKGIYRVDAQSDSAYGAASDADVTVAAVGTDYYQEDLWLKVTGAASATVNLIGVTINSSSTDLGKAVRVAVLDASGAVLGIWKPSGSADNKYLQTTGDYGDTGVLSTGNYTGKVSGSAQTISLGDIGNDGSDKVTVRVYLDGEDSGVFSRNIDQADLTSFLNSVTVNFTIPTT